MTADTPAVLAETLLASARLRIKSGVMNLILDPSQDDARPATAAFVVLAKWYAAKSAVRRLLALLAEKVEYIAADGGGCQFALEVADLSEVSR